MSALRMRMNELGANIQHDAQIRQWAARPKEGETERRPDAANCLYLERATNGRVSRQSMRPHDYSAIWLELAPGKQKARA